jgi:solute carrier family 25 carnitine/acylcarnitine transporter 20/29
MEESKRDFINMSHLKCSVVTGIAKVVIVQPFDFIRFRVQSSLEHPIKISKLIQTITDKEGLKLFMKGSNATAFGVFISSFVQFSFYQKAYKYILSNKFEGHFDLLKYIHDKRKQGYLLSKRETNKLIRDFSVYCGLAGCTSGIALAILTTPIDNIRIKLQARQNLLCVNNKCFYKNNTTVECIQNIYKDQGFKGFYLALPAAFVRETIASTIYFTVFEFLKNKERVRHNKTNIKVLNSFFYGALAGAINWLFTFPIDIVKTKLISDTITGHRRYEGLIDCAQKIYSRYGLYGFYTGFSVVLMRSFIVNGVVLTSFELCRTRI